MKALWQIFATIFKLCWNVINVIRKAVLNLIFFIVLILALGVYLQFERGYERPAEGALLVDLQGTVVDSVNPDNVLRQLGKEMIGGSRDIQENSLFEIVKQIRAAKNDATISGLVLSLGDFLGADQPSLAYIGKAISEFKASGKPVYAIGDSYTQGQYYLASFADRVYLTPQGSVMLPGIATNGLYYKSLLDNLKVTTHVFRVGTYKSAVEPFLRDSMSPEARQADSRWLNGLWSNYLKDVATNRKTTPEKIYPSAETLIAQLKASGGDSAHLALTNGLVDEVLSRSDMENKLKEAFGWDSKNKNYNLTSIYDYRVPEERSKVKKPEIAVISPAAPSLTVKKCPTWLAVTPPQNSFATLA